MKTVLVTGGTRGIGEEIVKKFCISGEYKVYFLYKSSAEKAKQIENHYCATGICCDITKQSEVNESIAKIGGVDVLINNAGISKIKMFCDTTDTEWREIMATNVDGMFYCTQAVLPHMVKQKWGKIINISSMWGITGSSCEVAYSTSKAAVIGMTKALAKELAPSNIQVNCVAPGYIDTEMNKDLDEATRNVLIDMTPAGRIGKPSDIANVVYFLASDAADFIVGQVITVDGGLAM